MAADETRRSAPVGGRRVKRLVVLLLPLVLGGCGIMNWFSDDDENVVVPTPLSEVVDPIDVDQVWRARVDGAMEGRSLRLQPLILSDRLVVAGFEGEVKALSLDTGKQLWETELELNISGGVGGGEGMVLLGGTEGEVVALDDRSGEQLWRAETSSEILSRPGVNRGVVVVRSVDGQLAGFNAPDGVPRWTFQRNVPVLTLRGTSDPLLIQQAVIVGLDSGKMAVLDIASGRVYWERTVAPPSGRSELDRLVDIDATPRVVGRTIYVATYQGRVAAVNVENGEILWSRDLSTYSGIDVDRGQVYVTDAESVVWALDRTSGVAVWRQEDLLNRKLTGPLSFGNHVIVGDLEGYIHWLDKRDGAIVGRIRLGSVPIVGAPTGSGDLIIALDEDGRVSAFRMPVTAF